MDWAFEMKCVKNTWYEVLFPNRRLMKEHLKFTKSTGYYYVLWSSSHVYGTTGYLLYHMKVSECIYTSLQRYSHSQNQSTYTPQLHSKISNFYLSADWIKLSMWQSELKFSKFGFLVKNKMGIIIEEKNSSKKG